MSYYVDVLCETRDAENLLAAEYKIKSWKADMSWEHHSYCLVEFLNAEKAFDFIQKLSHQTYKTGWRFHKAWKE